MWHETAQLHLAPDVAAEAVEAQLRHCIQRLPGLVFFNLGRNLPGSWGSGEMTLDLCFTSAAHQGSTEAGLAQLPGVVRVDRVAYQRVGGGQRAVGLQGGIWRTLMFRVRAGCTPEQVQALERDLLRMPDYMPGIRNWQLGKVCAGSGWTHVWQQEFAHVEDLQGEYLTHPFHWGWVDRWFDPEFPEWSVDALSHAFCPQAASLLTRPLSHRASDSKELS